MGQPRRRSAQEMMRRLARKNGFDYLKTCRSFANAERAGLVLSERKPTEFTPGEYAKQLWRDGESEGWSGGPA